MKPPHSPGAFLRLQERWGLFGMRIRRSGNVLEAGMSVPGRTTVSRLAPTAGGLRAVQQAVLRSFAATGGPPQPAELAEVAAPCARSIRQVLSQLHTGDFLRLDKTGHIQAAYPFSATPTGHRVQITGGPQVYAMCAIDALGIAPMLGAAVVIRSADPLTGAPITVSVPASGTAAWDPATTVVFDGHVASTPQGPAADVACSLINFFTGQGTAASWAAGRSDVTGVILQQDEAQRTGAQIFGALLDGPSQQ